MKVLVFLHGLIEQKGFRFCVKASLTLQFVLAFEHLLYISFDFILKYTSGHLWYLFNLL